MNNGSSGPDGREAATPRARTSSQRLAGAMRRAGFDYRCFHVMRCPLDATDVAPSVPEGFAFVAVDEARAAASADAPIRDAAWYGGEDAHGFALAREGRIACLQWLWHGERLRKADFWTFGRRDAVSMHLVTVPDWRAQGLATALKRLSAARMRDLGFATLYSRVWWTNAASLRVSEKAGWTRVGTTLSLVVPGRSAPMQWRIARPAASALHR